ncbi:hypothetical protein FSP39_024488 [Pinctada imbricata]|uniref:Glycosyltransferase family 92 protein n=1 Tax=Pinctada imbricata TaxID=66713 RepID=A0AA88YLQ9_PINIB|nr:hypothetical protein FSP39_024488 [Pinctada imbricata]
MHSNFNNGQELVEMIELNRLLGADFFIFYNLSSAQNIGGILNYYQSQGLVEIIQFNLPSKVTVYDWIPTVEGVHYYGQFAALNDCVYRNKGVSRYVVNQDMDEFIIPRKLETWQQLMENLPEGSYLFRSTIFPKDWPDVLSGNDAVDALKFGSKTVLKQLRETKVFPHDQRTKWIVRPECIVSCATHDVRKTIANESCRHYNVPETKAIIHHYHDYGNRLSIMVHKPSVLDDRINMYKSELLKRLKCKWNALKKFMTKTMSPIGFKMVASGQLWF